MASKAIIACVLTINLLFFALASSDPLPQTPLPQGASCPSYGLNYGVCAGVLNNLLNGIAVGSPPTSPCCSLFGGLVNFEAASCICKAIKSNLLGVNFDASVGLSLLLNHCGKEVPVGFQC